MFSKSQPLSGSMTVRDCHPSSCPERVTGCSVFSRKRTSFQVRMFRLKGMHRRALHTFPEKIVVKEHKPLKRLRAPASHALQPVHPRRGEIQYPEQPPEQHPTPPCLHQVSEEFLRRGRVAARQFHAGCPG